MRLNCARPSQMRIPSVGSGHGGEFTTMPRFAVPAFVYPAMVSRVVCGVRRKHTEGTID